MLRTSRAELDLEDIAEFLASRNPYALARYEELFLGALQLIGEQPEIGRDRSDVWLRLRSWPVPPYILFYHSTDAGPELVRVLHMSRLVTAELFD
jgi:toxin ParE1/3/4